MYPVSIRAHKVSRLGADTLLWSAMIAASFCFGMDRTAAQSQIIRNITQESERLEMTVDSSRILTLEKRIPRMVVNNPELVTVTPISANQVQIAARKPGVTQINLWDEDDQVFTVDVSVYGDVKELENALLRIFPNSSIKVVRLSGSLVLEGFVERAEAVSPIIRLAEDYAPKVINNIQVGGVQQILLKVKVMEVSRSKLRNLGFDFATFNPGGGVVSSISGMIQANSITDATVESAGATLRFGVLGDNSSFFGMLDALQQNDLAKILADPAITTVSGRPAKFVSGGKVPYIIGGGIGQPPQIQWEDFGTIVDFLPIVLGDGRIRLEVRPRVSDLDPALGITLADGTNVPGFRERSVDTGVELYAGQTLALAGLVQTKVSADERGFPFLMDLPYVGAAFRKVRETSEEVELLILVTPEFVDGMDPHQVPLCGPGMETVSPTNCQLYFGSHLEMPAPGICGPGMVGHGNCHPHSHYGCPSRMQGSAYITDEGHRPMQHYGHPMHGQMINGERVYSPAGGQPSYNSPRERMPEPVAEPNFPSTSTQDPNASNPGSHSSPSRLAERQNPVNGYNPQGANQLFRRSTTTPGLIGPVGYDMEK